MVHEVKNNHDAPLSVAGVEIAANGGVVGIEADALRGCLGSNGIKQWLKLGLIEIEGLEELTDNDDTDEDADADADAKAKAKAKAKADADAKAKADAKANVKIPGQK